MESWQIGQSVIQKVCGLLKEFSMAAHAPFGNESTNLIN